MPGPQALQACPNTLSNLTGPGAGSMCTLSGSAPPPFHPSSGWGSSLAREGGEGKLETLRGSCVRRPGCLAQTMAATPSFTLREPHTVCIFQRGREGPGECHPSSVHTAVWQLGSGWTGTFPRGEQSNRAAPGDRDVANWRHSILVKVNVLQIPS